MELAINSSPNCSTGYSPFFLDYGYDVNVPADLVTGDECVKHESVGQFFGRLKMTWEIAVKHMKQAIELQSKYYDSKHRSVNFEVGYLVLLNTVNLRMKTANKLRRRFVGPF